MLSLKYLMIEYMERSIKLAIIINYFGGDKLMPWTKKPISIDNWDSSKYDNFIFVDERGTSDTKWLKKNINATNIDPNLQYLTLAACIIHKDDFLKIKEDIVNLKKNYWNPDGKYLYKTWKKKQAKYEIKEKIVVFHSCEIHKKAGPFHRSVIDFNSFKNDLNDFLENSNYTIISVTIDKLKLIQNPSQHQNKDPYHVAYELLLERIGFHLNENNQNATIMNEWRGDKENKSLLNFINYLFSSGNCYLSPEQFEKISCVYFNCKRDSSEQKSFLGLEIIDLLLPSIALYTITGRKDYLFDKIKYKIRKYPNHMGKGIKFYP